jgi:hypothetical protein
MNRKLRSLYLTVILDSRYIALKRTFQELRRILTFRKRAVHVFLQLDDPYSYLLSHYLDHVAKRYKNVEFRFYLCQALSGDFVPQPAMLAPFLDMGDAPTVEYRRPLLDFLADEHEEEEFLQTFTRALAVYWRGDTEGAARLIGRGQADETAVPRCITPASGTGVSIACCT